MVKPRRGVDREDVENGAPRSAGTPPIEASGAKQDLRICPSASISMLSDAGFFGSPGIVMMSPESTTMNPAPASSRRRAR